MRQFDRLNDLGLSIIFVMTGLMAPSVVFVQGLYQDEIQLSFEWSSTVYYQGDSGSVTITLRSTCGNELEFS